MIHLLLATRNLHKAREIQTILGSICRCGTLRDFEDAPQVVEDADTFEGNALKKAETLAKWLRQTRNFECGTGNDVKLVLADDSGLEVDELGGAPGVHSARFAALDTGAAGNSSDVDNNAKLLRLLADTPSKKRSARFRCVLAVVPVTPRSLFPSPCCFEGVCEGRIGFEPRGSNGFGYDPLFVPNGFEQTFAELSEEEKNAISHRSKALAQLKSALASRAV